MQELEPIIHALFSRSKAGVFACKQGESLYLKPTPTGSWPLALGLAARLQHAPLKPVMQPSPQVDVQSIEDLTGPYNELTPETYEWATTDHLLAELYRHGERVTWVLGLWRPKLYTGHWSGLCWNGSAVTCSGLATCLADHISQAVIEEEMQDRPEDEAYDFPEDLKQLFFATYKNAASSIPSRTYMAGLCELAAAKARTCRDEGDPGRDLKQFVKLD